jgi:hypothetical protein
MFLFVMGLPGRFSAWCDAAVAELLGRERGAAPVLPADTLEELALGVMRAELSDAVISSRRPGGLLRRALIEAGRPFAVALDDPRTVLLDLVLQQEMPLPDAVQSIASSCAAFEQNAGGPGILLLDAERDGQQAEVTVAALARHFNLHASDEEIAALVSRLASTQPAPQQHDAAAWWTSLSEIERATVTGALASYLDREAPRGPLSVSWTHSLFFHGTRPGERTSGPVDITGRAHCLLQGPDILLPPGNYDLLLSLAFSPEAADREFSVEVCSDHTMVSSTLRPTSQGAAAIDLQFALEERNEHPISIRVSSLRASFDGVVSVDRATVRRSVPAPAEAAAPVE